MLKIDKNRENSSADISYIDKRKIEESSDESEEELESRVLGKTKKHILLKNSEIEGDSDNELELHQEEEKSEKERDLENLVFGASESSFINSIENLSKRDKKIKNDFKKSTIGDNFERKPAWNDDADDEMYFIIYSKLL